MLDFLKKVFGYIDTINPTIKTIIIMGLLFWCTQVCLVNQGEVFIQDYVESVEYNNRKAEEYSLKMSPKIKQQIENIKNKDADATNVILLSFHNTKKSLQGFSYMYITAIVDAPRGLSDDYLPIWKDLPYLQYSNEVDKIRRMGYLKTDTLNSIKYDFPQFFKKLKQCEAISTAIYPIDGLDLDGNTAPMGLIVVLYDKPKQYYLGYYDTCIAPSTQVLSTLLNYNAIVKQNNNDYEN